MLSGISKKCRAVEREIEGIIDPVDDSLTLRTFSLCVCVSIHMNFEFNYNQSVSISFSTECIRIFINENVSHQFIDFRNRRPIDSNSKCNIFFLSHTIKYLQLFSLFYEIVNLQHQHQFDVLFFQCFSKRKSSYRNLIANTLAESVQPTKMNHKGTIVQCNYQPSKLRTNASIYTHTNAHKHTRNEFDQCSDKFRDDFDQIQNQIEITPMVKLDEVFP